MDLFCESGHLEAKLPFDFNKSLKFLQSFPATQGEHQTILNNDVTSGSCAKAFSVQEQTVVFELSQSGLASNNSAS